LIKFPVDLLQKSLDLQMVQSKKRDYHEIHIKNNTDFDWNTLILYEQRTQTCFKIIKHIGPRQEIDLKLSFQYRLLLENYVLEFKILNFSR